MNARLGGVAIAIAGLAFLTMSAAADERAKERGRACELLRSFTQAAFAEGVDTGTDAGLRLVVERAGLRWEEAQAQLDRAGWRGELESNREQLFALGLWGVPSFRLLGRPGEPDYSTWGQDRLWRVEQEIRRRLCGAAQLGSGSWRMADLGLTHVALPVTDVERSVAFYAKYAGMQVVHRRTDTSVGNTVVWLSDGTRPFVIVLIEAAEVRSPLVPIAHLGVGCASRAEVERLVAEAQREGRPTIGPIDAPYPVGYFALISDPDQHTLELSHGQEVGLAVAKATENP